MVKETAGLLGYAPVMFLDDAAKGADVAGKCCDYHAKRAEFDTAVAAFGNSDMRLTWTDKLLQAGYAVPALIHPSAVVSPSAVIGPGCFIMQRAVVNTHTRIERAVLVNSGAVEQARGGHPAPVQAGASQVTLPKQGHLHPRFRGFLRGGVPTGAAADDRNVVLHVMPPP